MFRQFVSCHVHPASLDSASTLEQFAVRELELGSGCLTVTDHGSMAATRAAYALAKDKKRLKKLVGREVGTLNVALGIEGYLRDDSCSILAARGYKHDVITDRTHKKGTYYSTFKYGHLLIHFLDQAAYELGVKILTKADLERGEQHGSERKPIFTWRDLEELGAANTTISSGCLIGVVARHLKDRDDYETAIAYYDRLRSLCRPGRFFVEIFPHRCDRNWVQGVYVTLEGGQELKFHEKKNLRTTTGEVQALDLARRWRRRRQDETPEQLLAVMEQRVWQDKESRTILRVEQREGYQANDPCAWAPDGDLQAGLNRFMLSLAEHYGDRVMVSDDSHYAHPDEKVVQDVRLGAGSGGGWRFLPGYHRLSSQEAYQVFKSTLGTSEAEFERWVENTREWASWFKDFKLDSKPELPTRFYPSDTLNHALELIQRHGRFNPEDAAQATRLQRELEMLHCNGTIDLLPYFFPVEEVCRLYEQQGLLSGPGRGSAAGLLLSYLLGITHVDPLRYNLSLERFITLDRIQALKLPDIDQDLPHRDLLVDPADPARGWLAERFGKHVAQVSTDTKLKLRSSVKDVHRSLYGSVPADVEELTARMWTAPQGVSDKDFIFGYKDGEAKVRGSIHDDQALIEYVRKYPREWEIVKKCLGLSRNKSRHACAFGICNRPIDEVVPLTMVGGVPVTSFTAASVEEAGIVKYDFLNLTALQAISACVAMVRERCGRTAPDEVQLSGRRVPRIRLVPLPGGWADVWDLPEDQQVFAEMAAGQTETMFQLNTPGARKWLKHFNHNRPDGRQLISSVMDTAIFAALDRPGPLDVLLARPGPCEACDGQRKVAGKPCAKCSHNALVEYARRARGLPPSEDIPEVLAKLLPETYGVLVMQEQLQYTFQQLMGCTGAQAEEFRRAVGKKDNEKVRSWHEPFVEGAVKTAGVTKEAAEGLWSFFLTWAQYGFTSSHAVCYALIGYTCAWLKHYYPLEWWCATLRAAKKDEVCETFWPHIGDFVEMPEISRSGDEWEIQGNKLHAPLSLLDGVGPKAHLELVEGRPYVDIDDFCTKQRARKLAGAVPYTDKKGAQRQKLATSALHRGVVYKLIAAGALDSLFPPGALLPDKLAAYEAALAKHGGSKRQAVDKSYLALDALGRYQLRKSVLPVYGEDLIPAIRGMQVLGVSWAKGRALMDRPRGAVPLVDAEELAALRDPRVAHHVDALLLGEDDVIRVGVVAYVQSAEQFSYGPGKTKKATKWLLEVGGRVVEHVQWPRRDRPAQDPKVAPVGSIALVALTRLGSDLVVDEVRLVRGPLAERDAEE